MSLKKELKAVLGEAENQGWRVELLRAGHYRLYAPDGENVVHTGSTPSAPKALRELVGQMRRYGFEWKGR